MATTYRPVPDAPLYHLERLAYKLGLVVVHDNPTARFDLKFLGRENPDKKTPHILGRPGNVGPYDKDKNPYGGNGKTYVTIRQVSYATLWSGDLNPYGEEEFKTFDEKLARYLGDQIRKVPRALRDSVLGDTLPCDEPIPSKEIAPPPAPEPSENVPAPEPPTLSSIAPPSKPKR